jgi:lipopolysaccharide heptosyltransferase II
MKRTLKALGKRLIRGLAIGAVPALARVLVRDRRCLSPKTILLIRLDLLGDLVMSLPAARALKDSFPSARLVFLVTPFTAPLLQDVAYVDDVFTIDPNAIRRPRNWFNVPKARYLVWLIVELRRLRPDVAVSLFGEFACLFAFVSGAPTRVGFASEAFKGTLTVAVPGRRYRGGLHEVAYDVALAVAAGARAPASAPSLPVGTAPAQRVEAKLQRAAKHPRIVIHVGSHNGAAKRWRMERWAEVADTLAVHYGATTIFSGSRDDRALVQSVRQRMQSPSINFAGETDVRELVALLGSADLVLAGDSGPVHIASAVQTPVLGIYGPTDPTIYRPFRMPYRVVRAGLPCSPCYNLHSTAECPFGISPAPCMSAVQVSDVLAAARELLPATTIER